VSIWTVESNIWDGQDKWMIANSSLYFWRNRGGDRFLAMVYHQIPKEIVQNPPIVHVWSSSSCLMLLRSRFLNDSCCSWSASIPSQWRLELDNPGTSIWNKLILFACGSNAIPHIDRQVLEKVEDLWISSV
jgi:hypothetical protein